MGVLACCAMWCGAADVAHSQEVDDDGPHIAEAPEAALAPSHVEGVSFTYGAWLGWADAQLVTTAAVGVGFVSEPVDIDLDLPLMLTLWDTQPSTPPVKPATPTAACDVVRCDPLLDDHGQWQWTQLSQVVRHVRVGRPEQWLYGRAGPLRLQLGAGQLVDDYVSSPSYNRRVAAAYVQAQWPQVAKLTAATTNIVAPQELSAVSLDVAPAALVVSHDVGLWARWLRRLHLGATAAVDVTAPGASGVAALLPQTRPVGGAAAYASWEVLTLPFLQLTPTAAGSVLYGYGLRSQAPNVGAGTQLGMRVDVKLPYVAFSAQASATYDTAHHRAGVFGSLYRLERMGHVPVSTSNAPLPAGWGARGQLQMQLMQAWRMAVEGVWDPDPSRHQLTASTTWAWGPVLVQGALTSRPLADGWTTLQPTTMPLSTFTTAIEAQWALWGPLSLSAQLIRVPHVHASALAASGPASLVSTTHVFVGVTGRVVSAVKPLADWGS